jgi:peptide/nickel transport system substrate-binding protein
MDRLFVAPIERRRFLQYALGAAALAVAGCAPSASGSTTSAGPRTRPTLRMSMVSGQFGFPSPFSAIAGPGYMRMILMYDTLLWVDGDGTVLDWLTASHSSSADGLTWTFVLRDGVMWSDGTPLTADDVVFTFNYFKSAQIFGPLVIAQPEGVASVTATDAKTVQVHLAAPAVTFERAVAAALPIVPKHVWSSVTDPTNPKVLVGTGPYKMTSFDIDSGVMAFDARDDYFLGKPYVKRIEITPVGDDLSAVRGGALDVGDVTDTRPQALAPFYADSKFGVLKGPLNFTYPLFFNLRKGGALGDVKFRQACAKAINRGDILYRVDGGLGEPGSAGFLPRSHPFYAPVEQYAYDVAGANRMLDQAGYATRDSNGVRKDRRGNALKFTLIVENDPVPPAADLVVSSLKAIGVSVSVRAVDIPTVFALTSAAATAPGGGEVDMAITLFPGPGGTAVSSDPDYLRRVFYSGGAAGPNRAMGYANAQFDALAQQQLGERDESKRKQQLAQMQQILANDLPALPLYYGQEYAVYKKAAFDAWYYSPGGFATGIIAVFNKQVFVTGRKTGTAIAPIPD